MAVSNSTDRFNGVIASLAIKAPCVAVALVNLTLSGEQTVNGVAVVAGDRVLVIGQTNATENGIYDASSSAWARAADWDGNRDVVSGTFVTVADQNVGRNPYYQVTTANPITIGTTAVNFTLADGANVSIALTTTEIAAGLVAADVDTSKFPTPVRDLSRYVDDDTGVVDESVGFQNAANAAAQKGGEIEVPPGIFKAIGILLKDGVYFVGPMQGQPRPGGTIPALITAAGAGTIISTDGVANIRNCGVIGLGFKGLGAGTAVIGTNFDDVGNGIVKYCSYNNFSDQAILLDSDTGACIIQDNLADGCLLNRTRTKKDGVLDIDGNDHFIVRGEYNSSISALTDANARVCAVTVRGGTHMLQDVVGELSDVGIAMLDVTAVIRFLGCRADLNFGNGFELTGAGQLTGCLSLRNGQETTNTYDAFLINSGLLTLTGCVAHSNTTDAWRHRYGFNDLQASDGIKAILVGCRSSGQTTAEFKTDNFSGAAHVLPFSAQITFTDLDTTPDVGGSNTWRANNTGATSITNFDNGISGQVIRVMSENTNTTFVNGATLKTLEVANKVTVAKGIYEFELVNGVWRETGEPIALGVYTRNATIVEDRTLLASASATTINNNNVLAALIADLTARGHLG